MIRINWGTSYGNLLGAWLMSSSERQFDPIRRYSMAFLEKYVAGQEDPARILEREDAMLIPYLKEP